MSEYVVAVLPVLTAIVDHEVPPSTDLSILYPVIAEPPLFGGAVQERTMLEYEAVVALRPVGIPGAVCATTAL